MVNQTWLMDFVKRNRACNHTGRLAMRVRIVTVLREFRIRAWYLYAIRYIPIFPFRFYIHSFLYIPSEVRLILNFTTYRNFRVITLSHSKIHSNSCHSRAKLCTAKVSVFPCKYMTKVVVCQQNYMEWKTSFPYKSLHSWKFVVPIRKYQEIVAVS